MSVVVDRGVIVAEPGHRAGTGARPVRTGVPARRVPRRRGEARRPPTRGRVVAGHRGLPVADCAPRRVVRRWPLLAALAVAAAIVVVGIGLFASAVGGATAGVPERTTLVSVAPGETLWDVAGTYAPDAEAAAVVERIQELNGLTGGAVPAGTPLAVPYQPGVAPVGR